MYVYFPLFSAIGYGLLYVFLHRAYEGVNVITYFFWGGVMQVAVALLVWFALKDQKIVFNLTQIETQPLLFFIGALTVASVAWLLALYGIKNTSPIYTAFVEVSFPLFTVLFMFLIGGLRQIDLTTIAGGVLIIIGAFILMLAQQAKSAAS